MRLTEHFHAEIKGVCRVVPTPVFSGILHSQPPVSKEENFPLNLDLGIPSISQASQFQ